MHNQSVTIIRQSRLAIVCILFLASGTAHAASVGISLPKIQAHRGDDVVVPVSVKAAPNLGSVQMDLVYDPAILEPGQIDSGALLSDNCLMESNAADSGRVRMAMVSRDGITGDGVLVTVHFKILGQSGARSPLTLEKVRAWSIPKKHDDMPGMHHLIDAMATVEPGELAVTGGTSTLIVVAAIGLLLLLILLAMTVRRRRPSVVTSVRR